MIVACLLLALCATVPTAFSAEEDETAFTGDPIKDHVLKSITF